MEPEQLFLRYSFPCAHKLLEMGSITSEQYSEIEKNVLENKKMDRGKLMMLFPAAFRRLFEVAQKQGTDVWNEQIIRDYFIKYHNYYIDKKDGNYQFFGPTFCNFCKVHEGVIVEKHDSFLTVQIANNDMNVLCDILPNAKVGDKVTIHQGYAIEKIE